ncbi:hypothetical protein C0Q70_12208 [Pomacea canaliculata]|uniref:Homeobox domain-containing protein n=1 Tax=Pomacea canaliculata TaxID=400727 RepID=A0A2T7P0W3_POMCA|nr:hypothetical protein C0Q70_12208 [Pomacea canaliculata]
MVPPSYQESQIMAHVCLATSTHEDGSHDESHVPVMTVVQTHEGEVMHDEWKKAIYNHPLFPLMALLFEKCEQGSLSLDMFATTDYDRDIQAFVEHRQHQGKPFFVDDQDLDSLMLKAVQVLRIHLLELEKVSELCKDFCSRYITCLKGKLQSENLLRLDDLDSPPLSPSQNTNTMAAAGVSMAAMPLPPVVNAMGGGVMMPQGLSMATISQGQIISGNTVYQMVHTPQGIVAQPIQIQAPPMQTSVGTASMVHGNTSLSQIGMMGSPPTAQPQVTSPVHGSGSTVLSGDESYDDDPTGKRKNAKRGVLPKHATQIMKTWLFQHLVHPYPTEDEKRQISSQTNLTLLQVNNWFINARRRILQPMLDSGTGDANRTKKSKPSTRPQQRFWPEAIANITPQLPPHLQQAKIPSPTSSPPLSSPNDSVSVTMGQAGHLVMTANGQLVAAGNGVPLSLAALPGIMLGQPTLSAAASLGAKTPASGSDDLNSSSVVLSLTCESGESDGD